MSARTDFWTSAWSFADSRPSFPRTRRWSSVNNLQRTIDNNQTLGSEYLNVAAAQDKMGAKDKIAELAALLNEAAAQCRSHKMKVGYHAHPFDFAAMHRMIDHWLAVGHRDEADRHKPTFGAFGQDLQPLCARASAKHQDPPPKRRCAQNSAHRRAIGDQQDHRRGHRVDQS